VLHRIVDHPLRPVAVLNIVLTKSKVKVPIERILQRLGHRAFTTYAAANESDLYEDTLVELGPDSFCHGCQIGTIRTSNRGHRPVTNATKPGEIYFADIIDYTVTQQLTPSSFFPAYVIFTDAFSHYTVLVGIAKKRTIDIIQALEYLAIHHRPHNDYNLSQLKGLHCDNGSQFQSAAFTLNGAKSRHAKSNFRSQPHITNIRMA
jgi:hypothetical protein